jgi:hypothetical protein
MTIRVVDGARDETVRMHLIPASPGYLEALGARVVSGRLLEAQRCRGEVLGFSGSTVLMVLF